MRSFPVTLLNSQETLTITGRFEAILADMPQEGHRLIELVKPVLRTSSQHLIHALSKDPKCEYTGLVDAQDSHYDTSFMTFRDFVQMMSKQKDEAIAGPARKVSEVIERIGTTIHRLGYTEQLAKSSLLLDELKAEPYQQAIDLCGARVWYEKLVGADAGLRELFREKNEEIARRELFSVKETRLALKRHLRAVYSYIEELETLDPESYAVFASRFDEAVGEVIPAARSRRTRESGEEEGDTEEQLAGEEQEVQEGELQS